jgi:hypothetical protein
MCQNLACGCCLRNSDLKSHISNLKSLPRDVIPSSGTTAPVNLSRWFGAFFLTHQPSARLGLMFPKTCEECADVEVVFRRQLFTGSMDFRDDWIFPHDTMLP